MKFRLNLKYLLITSLQLLLNEQIETSSSVTEELEERARKLKLSLNIKRPDICLPCSDSELTSLDRDRKFRYGRQNHTHGSSQTMLKNPHYATLSNKRSNNQSKIDHARESLSPAESEDWPYQRQVHSDVEKKFYPERPYSKSGNIGLIMIWI